MSEPIYDAGGPIVALLSYSQEERARLAETRVRALLAETLLQGGAFCLLATEDCAPETGEIVAEFWIDGGWRRRRVERLDVVIIPAIATLARHKAVRAWLRERGPTIEDVGPDKVALPKALGGTPLERYVIPATTIAPGEAHATIRDWLERESAIVVKPADGNRGQRLQFLFAEGGAWALRRDQETVLGTLDETVERAAGPIAGRTAYRAYVVQKFVRSLTPDGRAFALRVDLHRDGEGVFQVVKAGSRIGEIGSSVSNVTNAGYMGSLEGALELRGRRNPQDLVDETMSLAFDLATTLDGRPDCRVKELGVDIGLDEDDRLWLFEANIQPQTSLYNLERARLTIAYCLGVASGAIRQNDAALAP